MSDELLLTYAFSNACFIVAQEQGLKHFERGVSVLPQFHKMY